MLVCFDANNLTRCRWKWKWTIRTRVDLPQNSHIECHWLTFKQFSCFFFRLWQCVAHCRRFCILFVIISILHGHKHNQFNAIIESFARTSKVKHTTRKSAKSISTIVATLTLLRLLFLYYFFEVRTRQIFFYLKSKSSSWLAVCSAYKQITMVIEQFATLKTKDLENSGKQQAKRQTARIRAWSSNENERNYKRLQCQAATNSSQQRQLVVDTVKCRVHRNDEVHFDFSFFIAHREHALCSVCAVQMKTVLTEWVYLIDERRREKTNAHKEWRKWLPLPRRTRRTLTK